MFERFTSGSRRALALAQAEAGSLNHSFIGPEHFLLGLIRLEEDDALAAAFSEFGIFIDIVRAKIAEIVGTPSSPPATHPPFTPRAKKVLELSLREALALGHEYLGPEHLLLAIVSESESVAVTVLNDLDVDLIALRQRVLETVAGSPRPFRQTGVVSGFRPAITAIGTLFVEPDGRVLLATGVLESFPPQPTGWIEVTDLDISHVQFDSHGGRKWSRSIVAVSGIIIVPRGRLQAHGPPAPWPST